MGRNLPARSTGRLHGGLQLYGGLRPTLLKGQVLIANSFARMTAYRAEIIIWMLSGTLAFVMMLIWMAQTRAAPGGVIGGYSASGFASYFLSIWFTSQMLVTWVSYQLDIEIRMGTLSPRLLRPLDPIWEHYLSHVAERLVRIPLMVGLVAVFALLTGAHFTTDPLAYLLFLALALLGFTFRFLWDYCTGLLAFWLDASGSVSDLNWLIYSTLGGLFAPLSFYPPLVQQIARFTPFPYMLGLPARLLSGQAGLHEAGAGLLVLAGWAAAFGALRLALWRAGLRKYGAVGA